MYILHKMLYALENITNYSDTAKSLIGNKCLSKEEISILNVNKLKLVEQKDIINYVCSCDKLNIINTSVIFYLDKLQNITFNFDSNQLNNYIKVRFPNYNNNNNSQEVKRKYSNDYAQFIRLKLFMSNDIHIKQDNMFNLLSINTQQDYNNTMFLIKPNNENSELLKYFEMVTFLKKNEVDQNMHNNVLNYISPSSKYVTDFAESVDISTSTCTHLKITFDTVGSLWFVLHSNNHGSDSTIPILEQSLENNNYYFLEYIWGYGYTNYLCAGSIANICIKYINKLNPFYSAGYSNVNFTFFDHMYQVALNNNCITPEFVSFISVRKLMLLLTDNNIEHEIFKMLFKSTYDNLHIKHKFCFIVYAAKMSNNIHFGIKRDVIYPFIHKIDYKENIFKELPPTLPLGDFFDYTELRQKIPSNTDNTLQWVCSKNKTAIATILTGGSHELRKINGWNYIPIFDV